MITKTRVSLGSTQLDSLDESIVIQSVEPQAGKDNIQSVSLWGAEGSRVTGRHRDSLEVNVKFSIRIKDSRPADRQEVFEKICTWAMGGGWMRTNRKPERQLRVICAQLPAEGNMTAWNSDYTITFRAYGVPYWQQRTPNQVKRNNTSGATVPVTVEGNVGSVLDVSFENTSTGTVNTVKITAGDSEIELESLGLLMGETLEIDHADNGQRCLLRIRIRNISGKYRSVLDKRTGKSSNDLAVEPGEISVKLEAQRKGNWTIESAGRFA